MVSAQQKAFCVLQFAKDESVVSVQRDFRRRFGIDPPSPKNIRRWYRQFEEKGCLCKGKISGRPRTSDEMVQTVRQTYERSPRTSTRRASRQLGMPHMTVWRVLRRRLLYKPYRLKLVHALRVGDKRKLVEFSNALLEDMEVDTFLSRLIFSDKATFHTSGKVN
ncbi:uncharacterized protein LOC124355862 [Homalodisca vitripennis]|uniref:uncharacterized protein LOC124355862 n=1 Tax=Homalodisca vitripennis TaxID=197043 RepID=UPI001EEBBE49|nr:uncharacterized protein LOC124355862 [Homalodisca vitripennis]